MKFYSETLNKLFDTEKDLVEAETKVKVAEAKKLEAEKAKKAARATRAKEVEKALKEANEAQAKAIKLLKSFTNDYGYFHTSFSSKEEKPENNKSESIVDDFFNVLNTFLY